MEYIDLEIRKYYEFLDHKTNILIFSDHGHKPKKFIYYINNLMVDQGLIKLKKRRDSRYIAEADKLKRLSLLREIWYRIPKDIKPNIKNILSRFLRFEKTIINVLESIDWSKTKCVFNNPYGTLYLNIKDRYPMGTIPIHKYEEELRRIIEALQNINNIYRERYGTPIFREIVKSSSPNAPYQDPDLILVPHEDVDYIIALDNASRVVEEVKYKYSISLKTIPKINISGHIKEGFYIFNGPTFRGDGSYGHIQMPDIAPIILYSLGLDIPTYMEGRIPIELLNKDYLKEHPIKRFRSLRFEIKNRLRKRLRYKNR